MSETVTLPPDELAEEEAPVPTRRLLVFEVAGSPFASEMEVFREIVPTPGMTRLPGAPSTVCGLMNLRGTIVTVVDAGTSLGRPPCTRSGGLVLLVDLHDRLIGFGVDEVRDIEDVPIDQFSEAVTVEGLPAGIVTGEVEVDGKRLLVLDVRTLVGEVIGQGRQGE